MNGSSLVTQILANLAYGLVGLVSGDIIHDFTG